MVTDFSKIPNIRTLQQQIHADYSQKLIPFKMSWNILIQYKLNRVVTTVTKEKDTKLQLHPV